MTSTTLFTSVNPAVLVGCGNAEMAADLRATLESWHYRVLMAENGQAAMEVLCGAAPPPIALLDMDLPTPGGVEIAWEAKRREDSRRIWVVLLSREASMDRLRAALKCGCDDYFLIPAPAEELKVRMRVAERVVALHQHIEKQSAELHYRATHDGLTGLWNREALIGLIFQETDRVQRMRTSLSLMLFDLDDFARINRDYGYEAGDRILAELASRFRRQLRSYDLIGRCGEDEFLLALPGCPRDNAMMLAARIRETILAHPYAADGEATTLTASFGIAASGGRSPLVVLREAERALAEAKSSGKNCARCYATQPPPGAELADRVSDATCKPVG
ncbi:MAG TPA: diguanylate cyclase response regulator [Acidobacteriaceae bacterium]|nr:diguanylate cyclase response regulator [Acidobacteriaceae bacterium]